jgi:hypothetical protein
MTVLRGPVDRRLWLATVLAIVAIVVVGSLVARSSSHAPSPIALRLAAAAVVTVFVAAAKVLVGPRAAALTGAAGTLIAVVLLITFA